MSTFHLNMTMLSPFGVAAVSLAAAGGLILAYLASLSALSGYEFAKDQLVAFWPFVTALSVGFGIQVGLFVKLRSLAVPSSGRVLIGSGTTSGAAMISCCAHYLVNVLPVLGVTGLVSLVAQYQLELFWVGIVFNFAGLAFMAYRLRAATREHSR